VAGTKAEWVELALPSPPFPPFPPWEFSLTCRQDNSFFSSLFVSLPDDELSFVGPGRLRVEVPVGPYVDRRVLMNRLLHGNPLDRFYGDKRVVINAVGIPDAMKIRVITKGRPEQNLLRPLQKWMHGVIRTIPCFAFTGEMPSPPALSSLFSFAQSRGLALHSADYASATDQIHPDQCTEVLDVVLDAVGPYEGASLEDWKEFRRFSHDSMCRNTIVYPPDKEDPTEDDEEIVVEQRRGQMMGNLLSFPILCVINLTIWVAAAVEDGLFSVEEILDSLERRADLPVRINGDDLLAALPISSSFPRHVSLVHWSLSVGKSYVHSSVGIINSMAFTHVDGELVEVMNDKLKGLLPRDPKNLTDDELNRIAGLFSSLSVSEVIFLLRLREKNIRNITSAHPLLPRTLGGAGLLDMMSPQDAAEVFSTLGWPVLKEHAIEALWRQDPIFVENQVRVLREKMFVRELFLRTIGLPNYTPSVCAQIAAEEAIARHVLDLEQLGLRGLSFLSFLPAPSRDSPPLDLVDCDELWFDYLGRYRSSRGQSFDYTCLVGYVRERFLAKVAIRRKKSVVVQMCAKLRAFADTPIFRGKADPLFVFSFSGLADQIYLGGDSLAKDISRRLVDFSSCPSLPTYPVRVIPFSPHPKFGKRRLELMLSGKVQLGRSAVTAHPLLR
jgi:hypothetical protein